jgi:hypothetical protein
MIFIFAESWSSAGEIESYSHMKLYNEFDLGSEPGLRGYMN